ncbi:hypothetical protein BWQ96_08560 [Gracilariopsis chorda]|uniref:Uncharacterized protein n=1 Tax=Gracilariopsis chorda TaxID=448386 RepID=A0A2V3IHZ7_9FLOR|nr:hypothetical protein BWQ96_08560 [Gracilariopsis chorda]|eukprot:PXF41714.1 hypothetical protein BWQ96_08560 [Gracilariopsis chorda]
MTNLAAGKEVEIEFRIVPNKPGKVEVALDTPPIESSTCIFEWDSSGATVEQWTARIWGNPRTGELECDVSRKEGAETYLMFTKFKTTLGTNPVLDALVHDNDGEMEAENFLRDGECIENAHDWAGGTIRRIKLKSMVVS